MNPDANMAKLPECVFCDGSGFSDKALVKVGVQTRLHCPACLGTGKGPPNPMPDEREWRIEVGQEPVHPMETAPTRPVFIVVVPKSSREAAEAEVERALDVLEEFWRWFDKHDGKADEFGRFTFVAKAQDMLEAHGRDLSPREERKD